MDVIPCIFSEHNAMKLEINDKKNSGKITNTRRLSNKLLKTMNGSTRNQRINKITQTSGVVSAVAEGLGCPEDMAGMVFLTAHHCHNHIPGRQQIGKHWSHEQCLSM